MAVEGLNNVFGIPAVKKEQEPGMNQKKKQKKLPKKRRKREENQQKVEEGLNDSISRRIDIKI